MWSQTFQSIRYERCDGATREGARAKKPPSHESKDHQKVKFIIRNGYVRIRINTLYRDLDAAY